MGDGGIGFRSGGPAEGPHAIAVAEDGTFWISDVINRTINQYSARGEPLKSIDSSRLMADDLLPVGQLLWVLDSAFMGEASALVAFNIDSGAQVARQELSDIGWKFMRTPGGPYLLYEGRIRGRVVGVDKLDVERGGLVEWTSSAYVAGHTYRSDRDHVFVDDTTVDVGPHPRIVHIADNGQFYVMVTIVGTRSSVFLDKYSVDGRRIARMELPHSEQLAWVFSPTTVSRLGEVVYMLTQPGQLDVLLLRGFVVSRPSVPMESAAASNSRLWRRHTGFGVTSY